MCRNESARNTPPITHRTGSVRRYQSIMDNVSPARYSAYLRPATPLKRQRLPLLQRLEHEPIRQRIHNLSVQAPAVRVDQRETGRENREEGQSLEIIPR